MSITASILAAPNGVALVSPSAAATLTGSASSTGPNGSRDKLESLKFGKRNKVPNLFRSARAGHPARAVFISGIT